MPSSQLKRIFAVAHDREQFEARQAVKEELERRDRLNKKTL
jgi:hypothetical protein